MCPSRSELDGYYACVIDLTKQCGHIITNAIEGMKNIDTKLGDWDLVTEYDKRVENTLIGALEKRYPYHKFIGEETTCAQNLQHVLTDTPTWIIDPIDGTTNFVHGLPITCISVALVINQVIEIGIVYNPVLGQLFSARRGLGAYLNGKQIHVSTCTELKYALVAHEMSYARIEKRRNHILERTRALVSVAHGVRSLGSAALTLCYVAMGGLDAYHVDDLYPWDMSAGVLMITEAGGHVVDSNGAYFNIMKPNVVAGSSRGLCDEIIQSLQKADQRSAARDKGFISFNNND